MFLLEIMPIIFLVAVLFVATIHDIRYQKIPNVLTLPSMGTALVYYAFINGVTGFVFSLEGICLGIAVMLLPYSMGGMGAGDAKLMGAVGAVVGPKGVFIAFLFTAVIGGIYALCILAYKGFLVSTLRRYWWVFREFIYTHKFRYVPPPEHEKNARLRYGIAIAIGTLLSVFLKNEINNVLRII